MSGMSRMSGMSGMSGISGMFEIVNRILKVVGISEVLGVVQENINYCCFGIRQAASAFNTSPTHINKTVRAVESTTLCAVHKRVSAEPTSLSAFVGNRGRMVVHLISSVHRIQHNSVHFLMNSCHELPIPRQARDRHDVRKTNGKAHLKVWKGGCGCIRRNAVTWGGCIQARDRY
eukprot:gene20038-biopygen6472